MVKTEKSLVLDTFSTISPSLSLIFTPIHRFTANMAKIDKQIIVFHTYFVHKNGLLGTKRVFDMLYKKPHKHIFANILQTLSNQVGRID